MYGNAFKGLFNLIVILGLISVIGVAYFVYDILAPNSKTIESKELLVPEIRLTTDGKKVDTIYIYRKL